MMDEMDDLLYKFFRDEKIIWFDYIDHVKNEYGIERKGLRY